VPELESIIRRLEAIAPTALAEEWDNVGLLVGLTEKEVDRIMTCLTLTPETVQEAVEQGAQLVVAHHPLPFRAVKRLTDRTPVGRLLLELIGAGIAVYSAHTGFDSAQTGINQQLAAGLGLTDIRPLIEARLPTGAQDVGAGRYGRLAPQSTLAELADRLRTFLGIAGLHTVGNPQAPLERVAVACGSGGEFLSAAIEQGCDCLVTGEARFHTALEAEAEGVALILPGHYASERFAMERLAEELSRQLAPVEVWASRRERDPLSWRAT